MSNYLTRAVRRDFLNKNNYHRIAKIPKMLLRNIFRTLLDDCTSPSYASEVVVDDRIARAILDFDDPDIVLDLRQANGHPNSNAFDPFWHEVDAYFNEITLCVDERRHGDVLHMPVALSIRDLKDMVTRRLEEKNPESVPLIPSCEWLRLQIWPSNNTLTKL